MISSQSVPQLAILASSLTLTCLSLIKSTLYQNIVIFISATSVEFVIFSLSLQPQLLQIHLSPANLTVAIHFISQTNLNKLQHIRNSLYWHVSLQILQNINTSHQHSKNYTGFLSNNELITKYVFSHTKHLQINNLHIFTIVFHFRFCFYTIFWFTCSFHSICPIITWQKGFSVIGPRLFSTNIPFQAQNSLLQNWVPSLGSFPPPLTVYPDFDSCYFHFMPYRMTPSVRHSHTGL